MTFKDDDLVQLKGFLQRLTRENETNFYWTIAEMSEMICRLEVAEQALSFSIDVLLQDETDQPAEAMVKAINQFRKDVEAWHEIRGL